MVKKIFFFFAFLPLWAFSQKSNTGAWYTYLGNQKMGAKFTFLSEIQYRNYNFGGDLEQLLLRTGIGYDLSPKANFLLGYAHVLSESYKTGFSDKINSSENRIFQQFLIKQQEGIFYFTHRYRFEERWLGADFKFRFRYFLSLNVPLNAKQLKRNAIYFSAYNEIFINTHSSYFDRNRLFGGLGYMFTDNFKLEIGLMKQVLESKSRNQFQIFFINTLPFFQHKQIDGN